MDDASVKIDGTKYDAYFILGVTPKDSIEHIQKAFKKKAKILHPDKMSISDKKDTQLYEHRKKHFNVLVECYNCLVSKKRSFETFKNKEPEKVRMSENLPSRQFESDTENQNFNAEFEKMRVINPNDFGYQANRMTKVEDYDSFSYTPTQQFNNRHFNPDDFNKAFEYQQEVSELASQPSGAIIHKTSDGFAGYNSGDLEGVAAVSSYNGVLIVGDNFGSSGTGYSDANYADYKQSFDAPKNPTQILVVPPEFIYKSKKSVPLTKAEMQQQIALQQQNRSSSVGSSSKLNFKAQEELLIKKQGEQLQQKEEQDKQFILQYQHLYDSNTINDALNKRLLMSQDYTSFKKD